MQKFQFFTSPLKMRACGTGRKFAEYDQRDICAFHDKFSSNNTPRKQTSLILLISLLFISSFKSNFCLFWLGLNII
jgi:hypothetical protein